MFHREIYAAVERSLGDGPARPFALLDLGCGDAAHLAPVLGRLDLAHYRGVDLAGPALDLAAENLRELACPVDLRQGDMLDWLADDGGRYDAVFSSFALHHLTAEKKQDFFRHCAERLRPGGRLLLIDVARDEGQDLPAYLDAYCGTMARDWTALEAGELDFAIGHVRRYDLPETLDGLLGMAEQAGFTEAQRLGQYTWHHALSFGKPA